jgi:protein TonB
MFESRISGEAFGGGDVNVQSAARPAVFEPGVVGSWHRGDRYGASRKPNLPAVAMVVVIHAVLLTAIISARTHYVRHKEHALAVVNLMPPSPPPPAPADPTPPTQPEVMAPRPIVQTPAPPQPVIAVSETPSPRPVPVIAPAPVVAAPAPPSVIQSNDLMTRMISGKPPRYPIESRRKKEQGTVVLSLTLDLDGRVASISISQSSGFSRLDDAARDAVRNWRWEPIVRGGQPVQVRGLVEIPFVLQG